MSEVPVENKPHKHHGQPRFTLIAQDVTADIAVDFWVSLQIELAQYVTEGLTVAEAIAKMRRLHYVPIWHEAFSPQYAKAKIRGAAEIAAAMRTHEPRRAAD